MFLLPFLIGLVLGFGAALWATHSWPLSGSKPWEGMWDSSDARGRHSWAPMRRTTSKSSNNPSGVSRAA
jgi:hypothetical protein